MSLFTSKWIWKIWRNVSPPMPTTTTTTRLPSTFEAAFYFCIRSVV